MSSNGFPDPSVHDHAFFGLYVRFLKFRSERFSTSSDYLNLWLRQIRARQNSIALDESENPMLAPEYRDDVDVDTQPASSLRKAKPTISSSYSDARTSDMSSSSGSHTPSSASHSAEDEQDDESGFLVHSDVDSLSRTNIVTSPDGDTLQAAGGASHRTWDNAATVNNMEGSDSSGRRINQAITDSLIRVEPQSQAHEECELCSDSSRNRQEHRLRSCFICHTTNMSQWIGDPDGLPLCKRLLHFLEL